MEINPQQPKEDTILQNDKIMEITRKYESYPATQRKICPDNLSILKVLPSVLTLQNQKESQYGSSWKKYQDTSAFFNLARKYDRIENIMKNVMKNGLDSMFSDDNCIPGETILDTLVDLGNYSLLWTAYIAERYPDVWNKFLSQNQLE